MKKLLFFPFLLLAVIAVWAWESLKYWFDPVTVDRLSQNGKVMKFHKTSRSVDFYLFNPKLLVRT